MWTIEEEEGKRAVMDKAFESGHGRAIWPKS